MDFLNDDDDLIELEEEVRNLIGTQLAMEKEADGGGAPERYAPIEQKSKSRSKAKCRYSSHFNEFAHQQGCPKLEDFDAETVQRKDSDGKLCFVAYLSLLRHVLPTAEEFSRLQGVQSETSHLSCYVRDSQNHTGAAILHI